MAMFVHLALESRLPQIRRAGLSKLRPAFGSFPGGVFAVPVTPDFVGSHQWLRELKRRGGGLSAESTSAFPTPSGCGSAGLPRLTSG